MLSARDAFLRASTKCSLRRLSVFLNRKIPTSTKAAFPRSGRYMTAVRLR